MGLSFFNAERIKKQRLEMLNEENQTLLDKSQTEEPTSPDLIGDEVGNPKELEEIAVKPRKKRK